MSVTRTKRADIDFLALDGNLCVELGPDQSWYETEKCYEIWEEGQRLLHRVTSIRKKRVLWVKTK